MSEQQPVKKTQRPTEPLPDTAKPALKFLAFLGVVVASLRL